MIKFLVTVVISVFFFTVGCHAVDSSESSEDPGNDFDCTGKPDGNYANPSNCSTYYACVGGWVQYVMPCPSGLHYSPALDRCEYPSMAGCQVAHTTSRTTTSTTPKTTTTTRATTTSTTKSTTSAHTTTSRKPASTTTTPTTTTFKTTTSTTTTPGTNTTQPTTTYPTTTTPDPETCSGISPPGCPNPGSATSVDLALASMIDGGNLCGSPPYEMSSANLYNLTVGFTATASGSLNTDSLSVYSLDADGNKIPNLVANVYVSTSDVVVGQRITVTAVLAPPAGGFWQSTTYYAEFTDPLNGQMVWCRKGDVIGSLIDTPEPKTTTTTTSTTTTPTTTPTTTSPRTTTLDPETCSGISPPGCPNAGSATNVDLSLAGILDGTNLCGGPPYAMTSVNLYNLTVGFTAKQSALLTINSLSVYSLDEFGNKIPNVISNVYISTSVVIIGKRITLTAVLAPPVLGVWQNTTYYAEFRNILTRQLIWCRQGAVTGSLIG